MHTRIVDLDDQYFMKDSQRMAEEAWERAVRYAKEKPDRRALVGSLGGLLFVLYYVRDVLQGEIRVIGKDLPIDHGYKSQVFTWRRGQTTLTLEIIISSDQISKHPGIEDHREVLEWGGFLV